MSQEAARIQPYQHLPSQPKLTYKKLSDAIVAYWSIGDGGNDIRLIDALHGSPRLGQWAKVDDGYRIWSSDEALSVTVQSDKIYTTKGVRVYNLQNGLPAQTLFNTIQTAQAIVQAHNPQDNDEDYFAEDSANGADLDAALADVHSEPLVQDDADLIEDVTSEGALDADQRREDGPEPIIKVSRKFIEDISEQPKPESFTQQANRKNAVTDGVQCSYCGNLNQHAYRGACPQCPKQQQIAVDKAMDKGMVTVAASAVANLKSLQGRILTIIDGTFSDKTQREAVKTLINKEFRREIGKTGRNELPQRNGGGE